MPTRIIDNAWLDLKQSFRRLKKNPGFAATAILSLALGVGANTAIFRIINAARLRSLPVARPQELVEVKIAGGTRGFGISSNAMASATLPLWEEVARSQRVLSGAFAWGAGSARFGESAEAGLIRALWLSPQTFRVLGTGAVRGHLFEGDDRHCDASGAVISYDFWQTHFGGLDSAIGSRLVVEDRPVFVVGVTPRGFFGLEAGRGFDVAEPLCARTAADANFSRKDNFWLIVMGRLAPGVTADRAASQMGALSRGVFDAAAPEGYDPQAMDAWRAFRLTAVRAAQGISSFRREYESSLWLLLAIAGMVLLIACANLANLLLAQAKARETEVAVRLALGMRWTRLAAQLTTESLVIAALGTIAGSMAGSWLSSFLMALMTTTRDAVQLELGGDWRVLVFTAALAAGICVLLGLAPLLRLARAEVAAAIRGGGRGGSPQSRRALFQAVLIVSQVAISLVLLVASLAFVRSFRALATVDTGFREDGLITCFADFSRLRMEGPHIAVLQAELLDRVREAPGVESAAISSHVPLSGNSWTLDVRIPGRSAANGVRFNWVSGNYFETLGIPVTAGRRFDSHDSARSRKVLVVNETFVRQFGLTGHAVGTLVRSEGEPGYPETSYEIAGVAKDAKYDSLRDDVPAVAYAPVSQDPAPRPWVTLMVRSRGAAASTIRAVERAIAGKDPGIRTHVEVLRTMVDESLVRERLLAWLSGMFAGLATLLTCIGLYGVIAYVVSLRRAEIAVRMALGATSTQIVAMILRNTTAVAAAGAAAGLVIWAAGGRLASSLLFHLKPNDAGTVSGAVAILLAVSLLATAWPALRASLVKPANALRSE